MGVNGLAVKENAVPKKYRYAAYGFFFLNLIYILLLYIFPPPFDPELPEKIIWTIPLVAVFAALAYYIHKGYRKLAIVLAVVYALRFVLILAATLFTGQFIESVPYVLTCLLLAFYMLGRAAWDWP